MEKAIKLLLLLVGVGLVIVPGYLFLRNGSEEPRDYMLLLFILAVGGLLIYAGLRKENPKLKPQPAAQAKEQVSSPVLSAFMLSRVPGNTTTIEIPLPQDDALIFVSEPSNNFFNVIIPQGVRNRVYRLIKPQLELYTQAGWELDTFEPTPREILYKDYKGPSKGIAFTKPRYRCTKVLVHLRRKT